MSPFDPHPSGSEDVLTSQSGVFPKSEKSQALLEALSTTVPEGGSFEDVAREALKAVEEIIREDDSSASPSPPVTLTEGPPLVVEDFLVEKQEDLTPQE